VIVVISGEFIAERVLLSSAEAKTLVAADLNMTARIKQL
jgi:hypothetical protein